MVIEGTKVTEMLVSKNALYSLYDHGLAVFEKGSLVPEPQFAKDTAEAFARRIGGRLLRYWFDNGAGGLFCEVEAGLKEEGGVTEHSTSNGRWLSALHGQVRAVRLEYTAHGQEWYNVHVTYADGFQFTLTGFGWGYPGTAPHGLGAWAVENDVPLTMAQVFALPASKDGVVWEWTRS